RRPRKIISRNLEAAFERSVTGRIHPGRRNARATGKIARPIPVSHPDQRRSHHAPEPPCARNARQTAIPRRRHRHRRRRSVSVALTINDNGLTSRTEAVNHLPLSAGANTPPYSEVLPRFWK